MFKVDLKLIICVMGWGSFSPHGSLVVLALFVEKLFFFIGCLSAYWRSVECICMSIFLKFLSWSTYLFVHQSDFQSMIHTLMGDPWERVCQVKSSFIIIQRHYVFFHWIPVPTDALVWIKAVTLNCAHHHCLPHCHTLEKSIMKEDTLTLLK